MKFSSLTKLEQQEIIEILSDFGLNEKEREVYFTLLNNGRSTITPIARELNYPATTVQSIFERLNNKGLINAGKNKSRHFYEANDPTILKAILERQLQDISGIMPLLKKLKSENNTETKIKIFYKERMSDIFHSALKTKDKLIYEIISADDFQSILGEKFHFTKQRLENKINLKSLRIEAHEIKKYNKVIHARELREAKFLPAELTFRASIMIFDNTVAIFSTKSEGVALTIESLVIKEMMLQIFNLLWSISRRMETVEQIN